MKNLLKVLVISLTLIPVLTGGSCRKNTPNSAIGSNCQRLSSCYSAYSADITDATLKKTVDSALSSEDETLCVAATKELGNIPKIKELGGCPF